MVQLWRGGQGVSRKPRGAFRAAPPCSRRGASVPFLKDLGTLSGRGKPSLCNAHRVELGRSSNLSLGVPSGCQTKGGCASVQQNVGLQRACIWTGFRGGGCRGPTDRQVSGTSERKLSPPPASFLDVAGCGRAAVCGHAACRPGRLRPLPSGSRGGLSGGLGSP